MGNERQLTQAAIDAIAGRLARLPDLRLPAQLRQGEAGEEKRRDYLCRLLLHDPGVFLERHGGSLSPEERQQFEGLRGDYEVDFWLRQLEAAGDAARAAATAKNRRLAYMNRLIAGGDYFSEREMRERQPALHHQYVGQFRPPEVPQAEQGQGGCILAETLMRQQAELDLRERSAAERRRWQQAEEESESESEEEAEAAEEDELAAARANGGGAAREQQPVAAAAAAQPQQPGGAAAGGADVAMAAAEGAEAGPAAAAAAAAGAAGAAGAAPAAAAAAAPAAAAGAAGAVQAGGGQEGPEGPSYIHISEEEQAENSAALLDAMKQRFLAGLDAGIDYAAIDADAELDEDWAREQRQDAEDKYFDDDGE